MSGLLCGKRLLVTGVITERSIGYAAARLAQQQGATVVLTGYGRLPLVQRFAEQLPEPAPVVPLDVTDPADLAALGDRVREHVDGLDGIVHSIAYAPPSCLGGDFLAAPWADVATALHASTYSYKSLTLACLPLLTEGSAIVGLTFDATRAWPGYDWMGVAKAGLESANRYLAQCLGPRRIRVNLVAAGPLRTIAAKAIPSFTRYEKAWGDRAPLRWDPTDPTPAARAVLALLSDWFPATTGEVVHVDGGYHALGA